eukprot:4833322-Pyramimonas_sp.AAC.1
MEATVLDSVGQCWTVLDSILDSFGQYWTGQYIEQYIGQYGQGPLRKVHAQVEQNTMRTADSPEQVAIPDAGGCVPTASVGHKVAATAAALASFVTTLFERPPPEQCPHSQHVRRTSVEPDRTRPPPVRTRRSTAT